MQLLDEFEECYEDSKSWQVDQLMRAYLGKSRECEGCKDCCAFPTHSVERGGRKASGGGTSYFSLLGHSFSL